MGLFYTLKELAILVGGVCEGACDLQVAGAAPLDEAGPEQVAYVTAERLDRAAASRAGALIVPLTAGDLGRPVIRVANPRLAFAHALKAFAPAPAAPAGVHPTAVVAPTAALGAGVSIGARVVVEAGARIGERVVLMPGVYVGRDAVIGDDSLVHPNAVIEERVEIGRRAVIQAGAVIGGDGFGFEWDGTQHVKIPHIGTVIIGDDVEIGANTAIDRGTSGATRIGRGTKIDNLVQVGHNAQIGENCLLCGMVGLAGSATLGNGVIFAAGSGSVGHVHTGDGAIVMAMAVVTKDVAPGAVVSGFPARPHREQLRTDAAVAKLPEFMKRLKQQMR